MNNSEPVIVTYIKNDKGDIIAEIVGEINIDYLTRSIYNIAQNVA